MIREWSEHETVSPQPASQPRLPVALATSIFYWEIKHFALQLSFQISPNAAPATKSDTATSPNTAPPTQTDSQDWSASHMKRHVQCAEQQRLPSNITKYCACHANWLSWLIHVTYETLFTMRGATEVTLQHHQILRLPHKMTLMIDPRHIWNIIYNAWRSRGVSPTSHTTAPATQNVFHDWSSSHMKRYLQCAEQQRLSFQISPNAAPATKSDTATSPNTAPPTQTDSQDWSASHMKRHVQCAEQQRLPSNITKYCACHANWLSWLIRVTYETLFTMRGATEVTLQHHQILRLPHKMTLMIDPRHIWNVIYNAWSITHYCACHAKWLSWLILVTYETLITLRGATKVTFQHHQILRLPRKLALMIDPRHIWNLIYNARSNRGYPPTSSNSAPATQNDSHDWSASHMKRYLQCVEQQRLPSNIIKFCACHTKWLSWLIRVTYETLFTMRGATKVTLQHHQILRLPRKLTLMIDPRHIWNLIYNARSNRGYPPTSPNTAPATQNSKTSQKFLQNSWNVIYNAGPIRPWSENDPSMKPSVRNRPRNRGYLSFSPRAFSIEK